MREVQRKLAADKAAVAAGSAPAHEAASHKAISDLTMWLERAERIHTQQRHTKNKLYALHAPEVESISKGKARNTYECGVKVSQFSSTCAAMRLIGSTKSLLWRPSVVSCVKPTPQALLKKSCR